MRVCGVEDWMQHFSTKGLLGTFVLKPSGGHDLQKLAAHEDERCNFSPAGPRNEGHIYFPPSLPLSPPLFSPLTPSHPFSASCPYVAPVLGCEIKTETPAISTRGADSGVGGGEDHSNERNLRARATLQGHSIRH